ncbi:MAG: DUF445 family protein [Defluviitaleaceae bacterium]|nr:DUF445 family protein [Defluviitaleaceae bacterium]
MTESVYGMLVIPVSGAVIGFFTNWIAIRMLFRPYAEKRLFGVRLPFTPGVIPTRRAELARKIGRSVGEHILTGNVLTEALSSPENTRKLREHACKAIDDMLDAAEACELSAEEFVRAKIPGGEAAAREAERRLVDAVRGVLTSSACKTGAAELLHSRVAAYVRSGEIERALSEAAREHGPALQGCVKEIPAGRNILEDLIRNDTPVAEYLGDNLEKARSALVEAAVRRLPPMLAASLENKDLDEKLEELTRKVIDDNLSALARAFVNPAKVYASIKQHALDMLEDEAAMRSLAEKAAQELTARLEYPVSHYAAALESHMPLLREFASGQSERLAGLLCERLHSLDIAALIDTHYPAAWDDLRAVMHRYADEAAAVLADTAAAALEQWLDSLRSAPVKDLARSFGKDDIAALKAAVSELAKKAPARLAPMVAASLNVEKLVQDQINMFGVEKIESLVLGVVRRELGIVIALGGLLGFVIGLVFVFAQIAAL